MKRPLALLLTAILLVMALAACSPAQTTTGTTTATSQSTTGTTGSTTGGADSNINPAGTFPIVKDPVTLSVFVKQLPWVGDLNQNEFVAYLQEYTNITLDMNIVPDASVQEKQRLMLSTNSYPEVFLSGGFSNADILKLGVEEKILQPLNEYIDAYGITIKALWQEQEYLQSDMTAPDGSIYAIPSPQGGVASEFVHRKAWINTEWLDNLGLEKPATTEAFKAMLLAFKNDDPNGNGKKDEIPFTGAIGTWAAEPQWFIMNAFVECEPYNNFCFVDQGKLVFAPRTDAYKQGLQYMAELYAEGLLDPASFTQDGTQLAQLSMNPEIEIVGAYSAGHLYMGVSGNQSQPENLERTKKYTGLPIFAAPGVERSVPVKSTERKEGGTFAITDKCQNPAAALRLADYLLSEDGWAYQEAGMLVPGVVVEAKPGELNIFGEQAKYRILSREEQMNLPKYEIDTNQRMYSWSGTALLNQSKSIIGLTAVDQDIYADSGYGLRLLRDFEENCQPYMSKREQIPPVWISGDDGQIFSQIATPLFDYISAAAAEFITGTKSFTEWDAYLTEMDNMKYPEWFAIYEKAVLERISQ